MPGIRSTAGAREVAPPTWARLLAIGIAGVAALANLVHLLIVEFFGPLILLPWSLSTFAAVGLVIVLRRNHPVGWLFLGSGVSYALALAAPAYTWRALVDAPGSLPGGELAAWITAVLWLPATGCTLVAVLLFPDGRPPSRRWWPVVAVLVAMLSLATVVTAFAPVPISLPSALAAGPSVPAAGTIPNPAAAPAPLGELLRTLLPLTEATALPAFLIVLVAVAARFARSSGVERQQLKWFASAALLSIAALALSFSLPSGVAADLAWAGGILAFGLVPVGAGIAILRYRLYDIDVVIRRTLVYGAVTAVLGAVYVALVLGLQAGLAFATGNETLPVALSTLAVAALFGPVRRRVQAAVDRRFYRSRYDAQRTVEAFAAQLRDEIELEAVGAALVGVTAGAVAPRTAGLWLRRRGATG